MLQKFLFIFSCALFAISLACQSTTSPNANNSVEQGNLPQGISTSGKCKRQYAARRDSDTRHSRPENYR
jgi:hypothetical protein